TTCACASRDLLLGKITDCANVAKTLQGNLIRYNDATMSMIFEFSLLLFQ
ncbi:Protein of unknown function, partial [Gryllus bimaculatus]